MTTSTLDLTVDLGPFSATEMTVTAVTPAGRTFLGKLFGEGAVSVTVPKSKGLAFTEYAQQHGISIR